MHTIKVDVSNKAFEHVMYFLNNLPKSDVRFKLEKSSKKALFLDNPKFSEDKETKKDIFSKTAGILTSQNIDPLEWQNEIRDEWDR